MVFTLKPLVAALFLNYPGDPRSLPVPALPHTQPVTYSSFKDVQEWEWVWLTTRVGASMRLQGHA